VPARVAARVDPVVLLRSECSTPIETRFVPSAIYRLVRERRLSARSRDRSVAACLTDFAAWHVVEITVDVTALARTLLHRHDLRAGDAIQLASAVWLRQTVSVSDVGIRHTARDCRACRAVCDASPAADEPGRRPRAATQLGEEAVNRAERCTVRVDRRSHESTASRLTLASSRVSAAPHN
jgi:hypothetical protein